jgi:structure-specific recognition protein 1
MSKKVAKAPKAPKAAKATKAPKEKKAKKAKKDKNAPKRAISAFFFYQKNRREGLKKEQPSLSHTDIVSVS